MIDILICLIGLYQLFPNVLEALETAAWFINPKVCGDRE